MPHQRYYLRSASEAPFDYPLSELPCTIGRSAECGLQLDFDRISRRHARIEADDRGLVLHDLGSTNGTFVNHHRIDQPTRVQSGDAIHFANHAFSLEYRSPAGETLPGGAGLSSNDRGDTIMGFTALPTGFPVQAPEFFEMLNEGQLAGTLQPIRSASGMLLGHALSFRSTHPGLAADAATLFRLAEELGEELRLAQSARRIMLTQASEAGIQSNLFLPVHAAEYEDLAFLAETMSELANEFRNLALVCQLPIDQVSDPDGLATLRKRLASHDIELCYQFDNLDDDARIRALAASADHIMLNRADDPERLAAQLENLAPLPPVILRDLTRAEAAAGYEQAGVRFFQGTAIGGVEDLITGRA